ncbi:MAG: alpha-amylase family glycosyl hydrolase [Elusimicrobiota bacterium]
MSTQQHKRWKDGKMVRWLVKGRWIVCFSIFLSFHLSICLYSELRITELPIVEVKQNSQTTLNLSAYIYNTATDKKLISEFQNSEKVECVYNDEAIIVKPYKDFYGLTYFTVDIKNSENEKVTADIIVKVKKKSETVISYKPEGKVTDVFIAGEFNGWNPKATRMQKEEREERREKREEYFVKLELSPGKYQYKFVVDGNWLSDPENPETTPDGFGGKNSVLVVGEEFKELEIIPKSQKKRKLIFNYSGKISNCLATVNNKIHSPEIKKNEIETKIKIKKEFDFKIIGCDKNGNFSNEFHFSRILEKWNWQNGVIYFVFIDRFCNGDKTNDNPISDNGVSELANYLGGDFQGIIDKINNGYFEKLGVNILWLSPVIDNPEIAYREDNPPNKKYTGYHGYWPKDFYKVEEHFGTTELLKKLVETAHKKNIKVIFDAVFNHTITENEVYKKNPQWFGTLELPDGRKNIRLFDEYPLTTWFDSFNPTFDFENNLEAQDYIVRNALWWIKEFEIDGFRLDAVKHVPHSFWKALRTTIREEIEFPQNKKFYMVGETISSREKIMEFVNTEELDGQFDFPLYWAIRDVFAWETQGFERLESELKNSQKIYINGQMSTFIGNHDFARFSALADGDIKPGMNEKAENVVAKIDNPDTYKKLKLAFTFILTNPGVPTIYYGDEIGLSGKGDPDNRRLMKFGFTKAEQDVFDYVATLIKIRNKNPAMRYGVNKTVLLENDFYAYRLIFFDNEILVILNRSDENVSKCLHLDGNWKNLVDGKIYKLENIELIPKSTMILKKI